MDDSASEICELIESGRLNRLRGKVQVLRIKRILSKKGTGKVFHALYDYTDRAYCALKDDFNNTHSEPDLIAWRARNLLELYIWSKFCVLNNINAQTLYGDVQRDLRELAIKSQTVTETDGTKLDPDILVAEHISPDADFKIIGDPNAPPTSVHNAAQASGMRDFYNGFNKLFSKFIHPTAMLIISSSTTEQVQFRKTTFFNYGCGFFVKAFNELEPVILNL